MNAQNLFSEPVPSRGSMFLIAIAAVDRPTLCWLKGNLSLASTIRAYYLMHLPRTRIESTATASLRLLTHFFLSPIFFYVSTHSAHR